MWLGFGIRVRVQEDERAKSLGAGLGFVIRVLDEGLGFRTANKHPLLQDDALQVVVQGRRKELDLRTWASVGGLG